MGGRLRRQSLWRSGRRSGLFIADSEAVDDGFSSKPRDFDEVFEGGLRVGVAESVVGAGRGVPLSGKGLWV